MRAAGISPHAANFKRQIQLRLLQAARDMWLDVQPRVAKQCAVGLGQTFLVNMWLTPASHAARYFKDYKVTITKPSGDTDVITLDSFRADTTAWFEYVADEEGTWKLKFDFQGGYFPAGNYTVYSGAFVGAQVWNFSESTYYKPSQTAKQNLT